MFDVDDMTIYVLAGPTAVGKTELSLQCAERLNAEILSCDPALFYYGMNIGTAKPTLCQQARIRHHAIDLAPINRPLNIKDYIQEAARVVQEIHERGKNVLVTGGSGFYLKSFYGPVVDNVPGDKAIRRSIEDMLVTRGLHRLVDYLDKLNPGGVGDIDLKNPRRVTRALERCLVSGKTIIELEEIFRSQDFPLKSYKKKTCVLFRDFQSLQDRIYRRTKMMVNDGLVAEVESLRSSGIENNLSASSAIGYRETLAYLLDSKVSLSALISSITLNTCRLVKKQYKWLRRIDVSSKWVQLKDPHSDLQRLLTIWD